MDAPETAGPRSVVVVGGGLAGLAAATYLARGGRAVTLFERAAAPGGRARTLDHDGYLRNFGPHALYRGGAGQAVLRDLGVAWRGKTPPTSGFLLIDGQRHPLPASAAGLLTAGYLSAGAKWELLRLLPRLARLDADALMGTTLQDWLTTAVRHDALRRLLRMLVRIATYTDDPGRQSAGAALAQLRLALFRNVAYLDGGWQTLVDGLRRAAEAAGVRIVTGALVTSLLRAPDGAIGGVRLADGPTHGAAATLLAVEWQAARALLEGAGLPPAGAHGRGVPLQMACLDIALRALPAPANELVFDLDRPLYLAVHSASARLAPAGGAVIHVGKYFTADRAADPDADAALLEGLLDAAQPGWRGVLVARRFLPHMQVTGALVAAAAGGLAGRPGVAVPGASGLYLAGDWVGPEGMLADAALASARRAATAILAAPLVAPARLAAEPEALAVPA